VQNATFMLVCLNRLVMYVVFLACVCEGGPYRVLCWGGFVCFCLCVGFVLVLVTYYIITPSLSETETA
jgi:hypothetical protein